MFKYFILISYIFIYLFYIIHQIAPLLFKIRSFSFPLSFFTTGIILYISFKNRKNLNKTFLSLYTFSLIFLLSFSIYKEVHFNRIKQNILNSNSKDIQRIGQHIIAGFTSWKEVTQLSNKGYIGGIFITSRNVKNLSIDEVRQNIFSLQNVRKQNGLPPLLVSTDQEGGGVSRLSPPLLLQKTIGDSLTNSEKMESEIVKEFVEIQSGELKKIGVNINFSPVVDIYSKKSDFMDLHTQIWKRSIDTNPLKVSRVGLLYSNFYSDNRILSTYKHFPGIGKIDTDTHFFTAEINTEIGTLMKTDLVPFIDFINSDINGLIMLSHTKLTKIDAIYPCSFSEKIINSFLRNNLNYKGILITDDLNMGPTYYYGIGRASLLSLNAGVDLLLIAYDKDQVYYVINFLLKHKDLLSNEKLSQSKNRLENIFNFLSE
ncbi:MAG: glycoside hydrolase family 3 protein [Leptospiraceae bacterium]|nr:glycoside hydrolase family 3 protein [Leptospiraceae bacterium]